MLILHICSWLYQSFVYLQIIIIIITTYLVYHVIISSVTISTVSICIVITDHVHHINSLHYLCSEVISKSYHRICYITQYFNNHFLLILNNEANKHDYFTTLWALNELASNASH